MTKEIYISSTPHETRLAVVEDDQLAEIYYERENEYTLAGSIYKGKVTRVLPGMQSAFVDIGLERDAFLYVTDFAEEQEDGEEYVSLAPGTRGQARVSNGNRSADSESQSTGEDSSSRSLSERRPAGNQPAREGSGAPANASEDEEGQGGRRWRGRRGRRRGRGGSGGSGSRDRSPSNGQPVAAESQSNNHTEPMEFAIESAPSDSEFQMEPQDFTLPPAPPQQEHSQPAPVPFVLPGESLSKYRRGDAPA
ncbi:MAG: ribonuclease, partial [Acidobacteriaceae bacterium]